MFLTILSVPNIYSWKTNVLQRIGHAVRAKKQTIRLKAIRHLRASFLKFSAPADFPENILHNSLFLAFFHLTLSVEE